MAHAYVLLHEIRYQAYNLRKYCVFSDGSGQIQSILSDLVLDVFSLIPSGSRRRCSHNYQ